MRPPSSYFKVKDEEDPVRRGDGADPIRPLRASLNYVKRPISLADRPPAWHCMALLDRALAIQHKALLVAGYWFAVIGFGISVRE